MIIDLFNSHLVSRKQNMFIFTQLIEKVASQGKFIQKCCINKNEAIRYPKPDYCYFVASGSLKEYVIDPLGDIKTLRILAEGSIIFYTDFGKDQESFLLLHGLEEATEVYVFQMNELQKVDDHVADTLNNTLQLNLQMYFLKWFFISAVGERRIVLAIADILISINTELLDQQINQSYQLPIYITHEIIAEFAAVSRSYVTRVIKKLKQKQLISYNKEHQLTINHVGEFIDYLMCEEH